MAIMTNMSKKVNIETNGRIGAVSFGAHLHNTSAYAERLRSVSSI